MVKTPMACLAAAPLAGPFMSLAATNVARVRIFCTSIRFGPGTDSSKLYTLQLCSGWDYLQPNGELFLGPTNHLSGFVLNGPDLIEPLVGHELDLVLADTIDGDGNGIPDLYEVNRPLPTTTTAGEFYTAVEDGTVSAPWQRPAGSRKGSCVLTLTSPTFGRLPDFTREIEINQTQTVPLSVPTNSTTFWRARAKTP